MNKYVRLWNTVKYLKAIQIYFRFYYLIRAQFRKMGGFTYAFSKSSISTLLKLSDSIKSAQSYKNGAFEFLNLCQIFDGKVDWNYNQYGKLWTYNLTYFEFLNQNDFDQKIGRELIKDFIENISTIRDGLEPFPTSLRGLNWIKFLTFYSIKDQKIDDSLYAQYDILMDKLEYHLLGNHLLENGFSLLFGAYYFQEERFYTKAKEILQTELNEQILEDGAHFELSLMYHQLMLFRVLDCLNLVTCNEWKDKELLVFLSNKASIMLGWLKSISYQDGSIPHFNDSTEGIAPTTNELLAYGERLHVKLNGLPLGASGYRKIVQERYECIVDCGQIGPDYIPGHAHADTFNFELRLAHKPFIVDMGLSTYEIGCQRDFERSTKAHNTVEVLAKSSSEVWAGFRVANRANIINIKESEKSIQATHDGYKKLGISHTRTFKFEEEKIVIKDMLSKKSEAKAYIHFHPDIDEAFIQKHVIVTNALSKICHYDYALGFNKRVNARYLEISFNESLRVEIVL